MYNNLKSVEFFDPKKLKQKVNVIGVGAVGGSVCEILSRLGLDEINIYDMDTVAEHNLANQVFKASDVGSNKVDAIERICKEINPEIQVNKFGQVDVATKISGIVFLCIDNIDIRRTLCTKWKRDPNITFVIDGRMRLTDGNIHAAEWSNLREKNNLIESMQYTHEEAVKNTPVSACGMTLSVVITPRILSSLMVSEMIKYINTGTYDRFVSIDGYKPFLEAYLVQN